MPDSPPVSILRVLLAAAPSPQRAQAWALFDAQGQCTRAGTAIPAAWPDAPRREAVLAASAVRLASIALPPMPPDRVPAAAAFALEDQLAGPAHEQHVVASKRQADGNVEVAIAGQELLAALAGEFTRVVAEPAVAPRPAAGTWRWYTSPAGSFVRRPDGAAFAVDHEPGAPDLPAEILLALGQASRGGAAPRMEVAFDCTEAALAAWSTAGATPFTRCPAWRWEQAGAAFGSAPDLLAGVVEAPAGTERPGAGRGWRVAAALVVTAAALHVAATASEWLWWRFDAWQTARAIVATAAEAGAGEATDAEAAATALAVAYATARHRAGRPVATDALPLLARAAPTLAMLPPGAVKTATYTTATWTFDLARLDASAAAQVDRGLADHGLAVLQATTTAGTRLRATLAPGLDRP